MWEKIKKIFHKESFYFDEKVEEVVVPLPHYEYIGNELLSVDDCGVKVYRNIFKDISGRLLYSHYQESETLTLDSEYRCNIYDNNLPTNCKNCGAPLHGYECEYCGTQY